MASDNQQTVLGEQSLLENQTLLLKEWLKELYNFTARSEEEYCKAEFEEVYDFMTGITTNEPKKSEEYRAGDPAVIDYCLEFVAAGLLKNAMEDERMRNGQQTKNFLLDKFWYSIHQGSRLYETIYALSTKYTIEKKNLITQQLTKAVDKWIVPTNSSIYDNNKMFDFKALLWTEMFSTSN